MTIWEQLQACQRDNRYAPGPLDLDALMRLMHQIRSDREITATERMVEQNTLAFNFHPVIAYACTIDSFTESHPNEPKDLAAVRRIIANWECPEEMSATEYINSRQPYGGFNPMNSRRSLSPANFRSSYDI